MADKLTLRGVKRIENYVEPAAIGDRVFSLKRPTTGKDQFTLKRWWTEQGNRIPKRYVNATCLDFTFNSTAVVLAVVSNQDTRLEINLNDSGDALTFGEVHSVDRIAIFSDDFTTLHYDFVIPKIAGVAPSLITISELALFVVTPPEPTFTERVSSADYSYVVTQANGAYLIDGVEQDTVTASAGETIHFDLSDASLSGHPFRIYTDSSKTTQITVGIDQEGDDLLFTPPIAGSFSYQCAAHAGMGGDITINA